MGSHFFKLFHFMSAIKEIHYFLTDFCALRDGISRFQVHATWKSRKLRKMGYALVGPLPKKTSIGNTKKEQDLTRRKSSGKENKPEVCTVKPLLLAHTLRWKP
jgi:hypothetical protein